MTTRSKRVRKSKKFEDFVSTADYADDDKGNIALIDGSNSHAADTESCSVGYVSKRSRRLLPLVDQIKKEPDETCVLSTDSVIDIAVRSKRRVNYTKTTLRSLDEIPMDVLENINPSLLSDLFGMLDSDELSRQFVYKCQLMPSSCGCRFKSFGNEAKARSSLERHLVQHIEELSKERHVDFVAESTHARERRLKKMKAQEKLRMESAKVVLERLPKSTLKRGRKPRVTKAGVTTVTPSRQVSSPTKRSRVAEEADHQLYIDEREGEVESSASEIEIEDFEPCPPEVPVTPTTGSSNMLLETESLISKRMEMIERLQGQLRLEKQPYKDHCYPLLVKGHVQNDDTSPVEEAEEERNLCKPYTLANRSEWYHSSESESEQEDVVKHDLACHYWLTGARFKTGYMVSNGGTQTPVVQLLQIPKRHMAAPTVGEEVVIMKSKPLALVPPSTQNGCIVDSESDDEPPATTTLARPYPPMPKYQPELGTKLVIPEEEMNFQENEEDIPAKWDFEDPEHVKKYAIRCMRELRQNKGLGARNCNVYCKICNREFTATATLMYHYRSHANIKPFCCLLCSATFTRQHSLNYHMLIHNDATRFKCPDCGRAFRHPSHYKEHRRKHTGEQPYHCADCDMRFKTRNSYKRHMNTKHPNTDLKAVMAKRREEARKAAEEAAISVSTQRVIRPVGTATHDYAEPAPSGSSPGVLPKPVLLAAAPDASTQTDVTLAGQMSNTAVSSAMATTTYKPIIIKMQDVRAANTVDLQSFTRVKVLPSSAAPKTSLILSGGVSAQSGSAGAMVAIPMVARPPIKTGSSAVTAQLVLPPSYTTGLTQSTPQIPAVVSQAAVDKPSQLAVTAAAAPSATVLQLPAATVSSSAQAPPSSLPLILQPISLSETPTIYHKSGVSGAQRVFIGHRPQLSSVSTSAPPSSLYLQPLAQNTQKIVIHQAGGDKGSVTTTTAASHHHSVVTVKAAPVLNAAKVRNVLKSPVVSRSAIKLTGEPSVSLAHLSTAPATAAADVQPSSPLSSSSSTDEADDQDLTPILSALQD